MGSTTTDGFPYPLPTDPANLAGQLEALANIDAELFCGDTTGGVNTLTDLGRLWAPPGFIASNAALVTALNGVTANLTLATRQYNNLHRNTEVPGPVTFNLPLGADSTFTPSWYLVGASVSTTTAGLTAGSVRQLQINLTLTDPFTLASTTRTLTAVTYATVAANSLVINEFIVAYTGTLGVQFYHTNVADVTIAIGGARVWVQKIWPASGPERLS